MMKKLVILGIVAAMVMGLGVAASAAVYDSQWVINIKAGADAAVTQKTFQSSFATKTGASDVLGGTEDAYINSGSIAAGSFFVYSTDLADGDATHFYNKDTRGSFTGVTKTWNLKLDCWPGNGQGTAYIQVQNPAESFGSVTNDFLPLGGETIKLYAINSGVRELLWTADGANNNKWLSSTAYNMGQQFQLEVSAAVPEPSSIIAMFSGLVGLAGFGIRRRK